MDISNTQLFEFLKENYKIETKEIYECFKLLYDAFEASLESINRDIMGVMKEKDFKSIRKLTDLSEEISNLQMWIESKMKFFDSELIKDTEFNEELSKGQVDNHHCPDHELSSTLPHYLNESFTFRRPITIKFLGEKYEVKDWRDVLLKTCDLLAEKDPELFYRLVEDPELKGRKNSLFGLKPVQNMNIKMEKHDIYVWTNLSANGIRNAIRKLLRKFQISMDNFHVYLRTDHSLLHKGYNKKIEGRVIIESDETVKIGEYVRESMRNLSNSGYVFNENELRDMQTLNWSKDTLGLNYPFMKPYSDYKEISQQIRVGGYLRYWKETFEFNGNNYFLTSQWYEKNRERFITWIKNKA